MPKHKKLIIISLPFLRLIRVLLGKPVLNVLRNIKADVLIISPFADREEFQEEFALPNMHFWGMDVPDPIPMPWRILYGISENLRLMGYWHRYADAGMAYYDSNKAFVFGENGNDRKIPFLKRIANSIFGLVGKWCSIWRLFDAFVGGAIFDNKALLTYTQAYDQVTLVQAASWGLQDRLLGWMGRKYTWRTVLVPYTTDQLWCNGYLISDFDMVCVQGPCEYFFAEKFHGIPQRQIKCLGSAWFRNIDALTGVSQKKMPSNTERFRIMLAGSVAMYFPTESEFGILEWLVDACRTGVLQNTEIIYRPLGENDAIRRVIEDRFSEDAILTIQYSQQICYGLDRYAQSSSSDDELCHYLAQISACDLLVTAGTTTLALDIAYLGIPTIFALVDPSGVLEKRNTRLLLDENLKLRYFEKIPLVLDKENLLSEINRLKSNPEVRQQLADAVVRDWDYNEADFHTILKDALSL